MPGMEKSAHFREGFDIKKGVIRIARDTVSAGRKQTPREEVKTLMIAEWRETGRRSKTIRIYFAIYFIDKQ